MGLTGLDFQTVAVKFDQGLETDTQKKLVLPGKWDTLQNVSLTNDGTPRRRDGIGAVVSTANGGGGNGLATLNKELLIVNGSTLKSVSTAGAIASTRTGTLGNVAVTKTEVRRSAGMQSALDCANGGGYTCYVWRDASFVAGATVVTGLNCTIVDELTGVQLLANIQLKTSATIVSPRVVFSQTASGGSTEAFMVFYIEGTSLCCIVIETAAGAMNIGAEVQLITSAQLSLTNFDAISAYVHSIQKGAMLSYWWVDPNASVRTLHVKHVNGVPSIDAGPTTLFTRAQLSDVTLQSICCVAFSPTLYGTFAVARTGAMAGIAGAVIDDTWAVTTAAAQIDATVSAFPGFCHITGTLEGTTVWLYSDQASASGSGGFVPIRTTGVSSVLVTTGLATLINSASFGTGAGFPSGPMGPWICGKAFTSGTKVYLPVCVMESYTTLTADVNTKNEQNCLFLLECLNTKHDTAAIVGKALYGTLGIPYGTGALGANPLPAVSTPCSVPDLAPGFAMACLERQILSISNGLNVSASGVCRLTFNPNTTQAPIRAQLGQSTYFAGGQLCAYDGLGVAEQGFPLFPEGVSVLRNAAAGDLTAGVHQVVFIYEWVDNQGYRHQSSPSQPVSFTSLGGDTAVCVVPTLLLSQKTGVQIVGYMTQAAGLTFNRVISIASPVPNVTTAASVTFSLGVAAHLCADATIAGNELLYNQPNLAGTVLPNLSPGPSSAVGLHQNRLFCDVTDNPNAYVYSQQLVPYVGLQFNPALGGAVPESGGGIVAWSELDEKMIMLCARKLFVIYGQGATPSGGFSSYSDPQEIASDVGCVEARSVLKMPMGIIFKAQKGWYLLGRDLQVRYIGAGVQAYNANNVSAAVLLEDRRECRFSSTSGTQLIYSYHSDTWSTTVYRVDNGAGAQTYIPVDAIWWATPVGGEYVTVSAANGANSDTPGVYFDQPAGAGNPLTITTTARTVWLHPSVLNGYQRIRWMFLTGTAPTQPTSTLNIAVDFDDVYGGVAPGSYNFNIAYAGIALAGQSVDTRSKLRRQKCKSIAFTFTDTPLLSNPAGVNFQALSLEIGIKRGLNRLPAAQSVG